MSGIVGFATICLGFGSAACLGVGLGATAEAQLLLESNGESDLQAGERGGTELGPSLLVYPASYPLWLPPASLLAGRPLREACKSPP